MAWRVGAALIALCFAASCGGGTSTTAGPSPVTTTTTLPPTATTAALTGSVSGQAGAKLAGATVQVTSGTSGATATTDANGAFRFDALAVGSATLVAKATGYVDSTRTVTVNGTNTLDFTLSPTPSTTGSLTGTVSNDTGTRLDGATVQITSGAGSGQTAPTNTAGVYHFDSLPIGSTSVVARSPGHSDRTSTVTVAAAGSTLNFVLTPTGPRTQFGAGLWFVNTQIAAGRYFSDPVSGCYWERRSGVPTLRASVLLPHGMVRTRSVSRQRAAARSLRAAWTPGARAI